MWTKSYQFCKCESRVHLSLCPATPPLKIVPNQFQLSGRSLQGAPKFKSERGTTQQYLRHFYIIQNENFICVFNYVTSHNSVAEELLLLFLQAWIMTYSRQHVDLKPNTQFPSLEVGAAGQGKRIQAITQESLFSQKNCSAFRNITSSCAKGIYAYVFVTDQHMKYLDELVVACHLTGQITF